MPNVSLATFARYVTDAAQAFRVAERLALEDAGRRIEKRAKGYLGRQQATRIGPFRAWAPLAEATLADKAAKGWPTPSPLLRSGDMRESIEHRVARRYVDVGSNDLVALWQEMGTAPSGTHPGIPPRPFIGRAMAELGRDEVVRIGHAVFWPLLRRSRR